MIEVVRGIKAVSLALDNPPFAVRLQRMGHPEFWVAAGYGWAARFWVATLGYGYWVVIWTG